MPTASPLTTALPNVEADPSALRIVLFGMPDAGKSSLLGALVQAMHMQDRILQGRLLDLTNGMAELWRRVYEDRQRETLEEIVPYPVYFEPYAGDPDATPALSVMLYDCDGRVANELLSQRQSLRKNARAGSLARALADADALILTVDASASHEQVETDFREFVRFLRVLETHRSRDHAVAGLPVFLALSKCDRLVTEPIPKIDWQQRIAQRQAQVKERFARYLEGSAGLTSAFGSLDLRMAPTAVKQPALSDAPAQPRTPFGVAELFHDCLRSAYHFRERCRRSNRRLNWVVAGAVGFLAMAGIVAAMLIGTGGPVEKTLGLSDKVAHFESTEKDLPDRLADNLLQRRTAELSELHNHPDFGKLPDNQRSFVRDRLDELQSYVNLRDQLAVIPTPETARSVLELDQIRDKLEALSATMPAAYKEKNGPARPPALAERERRLQTCRIMRGAIEELKVFYTALKNQANDRLFDSEFQSRWDDRVNALVENEKNPPISRSDGPSGLAYAFMEVASAEKEWLTVRQKLLDLRDLATAVGLTRDQPGQSAVLLIPSIPPDANMNSWCAVRLESLKKLYPSWKTWSLAGVSDALQGELRKKLTRSFDQMIRDGQRMILDKLRQVKPTGDDTPRDWQEVDGWLMSPALADWRDLLGVVGKLLDPASEDPATAAAAFLRKDRFDMQLRSLTVSIPRNLPQGMMTPADKMQVQLRPQAADSARSTLSFRLDKQATIDGARDVKYRFILDDGDGRLVFKPGDEFRASLPLTKGTKNWEFTWSNGATASYAFDCLAREPHLRAEGAADHGSPADGVTVTIEGKFPTIPALLPDVRRERK